MSKATSKATRSDPLGGGEAVPETVTIKITSAQSNPVNLWVNGATVSIRHGVATEVPAWAVAALTSSDAAFEVIANG